MTSYQDAIAAMLRPTETCPVSLELNYVKKTGERKRRCLAVFRNVQGGEEAGVFILKRRAGNTALVFDMLPIFSDFRLTVSQSKAVKLDDPERLSPSRTDFTLRLSSGNREMKLETAALEKLQPMLVELKRLMAVAQQRNYVVDGGTHTWMQFYEHSRKSASMALKQAGHTEEAEQDRAQATMANPFISFDNSVSGSSIKTIKEGWAARELRARETKVAAFEQKRIFVGSWNVNGQSPTQPLFPWLRVAVGEEPSLYVLGFQELDLNTGAYLYSDTTKEDEWCKGIENALKTKTHNFVKVVSKQLVGMLIVLYVNEAEKEHVREVSAEYLGTGLLGMMGNKGAAAIRFRFYDSFYCFVNSHLAADASMVDRRNSDYAEICRRITFPLTAQYPDFTAYAHNNPWVASFYDARQNAVASSSENAGKNVFTIFDTDHLFFLGDLNYRISLPDTDVKQILKSGDVKQLLKFDQLLIEQRARRAFHDFNEAAITFAPTFKYDIGTNTFDTSEKKRTPSFCDRILWFQNPLHVDDSLWICPKWYRSCMDLTLSDHKPIMALFETAVRTLDKAKLMAVNEDITRELDKFENESLPDLHITTNILEFGDIRYNVPVTKTLLVENKGQVIAQYRFVPKPDQSQPCKPWCYVNPPVSSLLPGDQLKINVTILVDNQTVPTLNAMIDTLDDILILHTENGKDHFLSVSGNWLPSCFGTKVEALCKFVRPVREWSTSERKTMFVSPVVMGDSGGAIDDGAFAERAAAPEEDGLSPDPPALDAENRFSIPYQLWRMVDFLFRYGMDVDNLFTSGGDPAIEEYIRECLDTGVKFDLTVLLLDPDTAAAYPEDDPDDGDESPPEDLSRRTSAADTPPQHPSADAESGSRTPVDKRDSVHLDLDTLLKDVPTPHTTTLLGLGSTTSLEPATHSVPLPRARGRAVAVASMAETLLRFLDSLEESVVPTSMSMRCTLEGYLTYVAARQTVMRLPPTSYNVFKYLVKFLRAVVENYKGRGELDVERLADIFAPAMLRLPKLADGTLLTTASGGNTVPEPIIKGAIAPGTTSSATTSTSTLPKPPSTTTATYPSGINIKYATFSTGKSGLSLSKTQPASSQSQTTQSHTTGKVMVGGGTGGSSNINVASSSAAAAASSSSSNPTSPSASASTLPHSKAAAAAANAASAQEDVVVRKRRLFLMHFLNLDNPELL
ncbi:hypothetical protein PhCBS80983_g05190 [Powellomyces hirtus]|uniref:Rho-GAP domain-containing protein n=1 Tax=Powellomyces hirtus TaxID=109895 RepID=A0A507DXB8_9FUNG|nr:hypothetical protein PhCBS80983_g05190 [Powellomyces hirtus]